MAFFLIAPCVMAVSIILVRNVTSALGLEIKYSTLFLCAVLSVVTLFGAMKISPTPDKNFFLCLTLLVLPAAACAAALNSSLVKREKQDEIDFTEEVRRAYAEATKKSSTESTNNSETEFNSETKFDSETKNESDSENADSQNRSEERTYPEYLFEDFKNLGELLEYARSEKKRGNIQAAVDAYQVALDEYPADDYAPFVAIDLGAIYREQAAYAKAIKVYEQAKSLLIVKKNAEVTEEFQKKIVYMETLQAVLFRHKALQTPFSQIPRKFFQEIETEFKENWRQLKANDQRVLAKN